MKILLLEDDRPTSEFLTGTLVSHRYAVDAIADGATGLDLASRWPYDLLIIDRGLPSLDGLEVCRRLRAQGCRTPILMLTVRDSSDDIVAGLDAGADDYLAKGCDASQLLARVRALLRRGNAAPVLGWGDLCLDPALTQVTYQGQPIPCRPKEYELLELFLRNPQRLLTRSAIIDHLWPMDDPPVEGSITNLMKDLRQRLKAAGLTNSPIETVYGLGYRLKPAPVEKVEAEANLVETKDSAAELVPATPRLDLVMQQATQRFQVSLEQRLRLLEEAVQAVEAGTFSPQQRRVASTEAHKLAGGLGLFGYTQASEVAELIEQLLQLGQPSPLLAQHLEDLKQSLTLPVD
ncbi:response regulator [Nodosilinea sp. LEGE 06152]|uniref:response regulator n=1 Tax=Nodosilinea sp. LEGE 06152 TaxID=2777966 RepID=UPI00187F415A|nr:response regulator [Nodosilinea sp. LEGE 06152]MBE9160423.1 response regulator [Nodosilinea sp. LEGE 06152]